MLLVFVGKLLAEAEAADLERKLDLIHLCESIESLTTTQIDKVINDEAYTQT